LFEDFAKKNSNQFNDLNVKKVVALSPHSYNTFKNDYPNFGLKAEVIHYSQLLLNLIESGKLNVSKGFSARVTYHDPCYLGRWNKEYDAPRKVLNSIPGIELIEMQRNRENSFCCGGGGGNFYSDFLGGKDGASCLRVKEAYETGAEVLAVACPICTRMLFDAIKTEDLEDKLRLMDISELVLAACA
jgi:Fe-S oxidoreductase